VINLTFQNIEELIFFDNKVQQLFPEFSFIFNKWILGTRSGMKSMAKDALFDFINIISNDQLDKISDYWGLPVSLQRIDSSIVKNIIVNKENLQDKLCELDDWNVSIARKDDQMYLSCWR